MSRAEHADPHCMLAALKMRVKAQWSHLLSAEPS